MKLALPVLFALLVAGCTVHTGSFHENSYLDSDGTVRIRKGTDMTIECGFSSGPGSGTEDFFLQFLKPEEIHEGQVLDIRDSSILVYLVRRAPGRYDVISQENLEGRVEVRDYTDSLIVLIVTIGSERVKMKLNRGALP